VEGHQEGSAGIALAAILLLNLAPLSRCRKFWVTAMMKMGMRMTRAGRTGTMRRTARTATREEGS
jgi:hypothetical protein